MKILIAGASGAVGRNVLRHALAHPNVTSVVTFCRQQLPIEVLENAKLECVIISDFRKWPEDVLRAHSDAAAMIWMMGTYDANVAVNAEYPMVFQESFVRVLEAGSRKSRFRFVSLSGCFVEQDQSKKLYFLDEARKVKGAHDTKAIQLAGDHKDIWQTFIVRPAAILQNEYFGAGVASIVIGKTWSVRIDELAAYMTYLAVGGEAPGTIIANIDIVNKGRELLRAS